jgi:hypothetical protein
LDKNDSINRTSEAAETHNSNRPSKIITSPFFAKTPTAPASNPVPTTARKLTEIHAKRQIELQSHRKQALAVCDSDSESDNASGNSNSEDEVSSEASWKCSRSSSSGTDESEVGAKAAAPVAVRKPRAVRKPTARKPESIQFHYESDDQNKENELNESITKKVLNLLDSCVFKQKPMIPATP